MQLPASSVHFCTNHSNERLVQKEIGFYICSHQTWIAAEVLFNTVWRGIKKNNKVIK